jgi:hypothetical protein
VSHQGDLWCLDAATGRKVWYKHYQKNFGGRRPEWGYAGSPTVEGKMLLLDVGGKGSSTVALDKTNGNVIWKAGDDEAGYGSPVVATMGGKRTIVVFKASHLVGLDAATGRELWRTEWKTSYDVNAATPVVIGDRILISSGYNHGAALYAVSSGKVSQVWANKKLRSHFNSPWSWMARSTESMATPVVGILSASILRAVSRSGSRKAPRVARSFLPTASSSCSPRKANSIIADASPSGFHAISRANVLSKRCWVQPTLVNGRLFVPQQRGRARLSSISARNSV